MAGVLRHPDWHLLSGQKFRQRLGIEATPQVLAGERSLILSDRVIGQHLRLYRRAEALWTALDGSRTVNDIWRDLANRYDDAPTQGEIVDWLLRLASLGMILSDHTLDPAYLAKRSDKRQDKQLEGRVASPLSVKIGLFDPSRLIAWSYPLVAPLYSRAGQGLVVLVMLAALLSAVLDWQAVRASIDRQILSQSGAMVLLFTYPLMKALHELAHGWTLHRHGGAVREAGVMLLIFFPVPYVDASDATALPDKRARMAVGAAGIYAELAMASVAFLLWQMAEPGLVKAMLFSVVVMGTVSTVLFNGNPLLKFDAYYVMADWLEVPNLAQKAGEYLQDVWLGVLAGLRRTVHPRPREAAIYWLYGPTALTYRMLLMFVIGLMVSRLFYGIGVLLALWAVVMTLGWPIAKMAGRGVRQARAQGRSGKAVLRSLGALAVIGGLAGWVPLPFSVAGSGRVVVAETAEIRTGASGFVQTGARVGGAAVEAGQTVLRLTNDALAAQKSAQVAALAAIDQQLARAALPANRRRELITEQALAQQSLAETERQIAALEVSAPVAGILEWDNGRPPTDGGYLAQGDRIARIIAEDRLATLLAFPAAYASEIRASGAGVRLWLPDGTAQTVAIGTVQTLDSGSPAPEALAASSGGPVATDGSGHILTPQLIIRTDLQTGARAAGALVRARVDLAPRPALAQLAFHLRSLFLRVVRV